MEFYASAEVTVVFVITACAFLRSYNRKFSPAQDPMADRQADLLIIGAGIVGLATALQYTRRFPGKRLLVIEKEDRVAAHQTGHNSGVIHSGLYYRTGSLKARNCVAGCVSMKRFCTEHNVPFEEC